MSFLSLPESIISLTGKPLQMANKFQSSRLTNIHLIPAYFPLLLIHANNAITWDIGLNPKCNKMSWNFVDQTYLILLELDSISMFYL